MRNENYALIGGHLSRGAQDAQTPDWLWNLLEKTYGKFDFDPCPPNPKFNGLEVPWKRLNFVNPPFKEIKLWLRKAVEEMDKGHATLFLVPFRPDREYFQKYVVPHAAEVRILSQLVQFKGFDKPFPQRMAIYLFGKPKRWLLKDITPTVPLYTMKNVEKTFESMVKTWSKLRKSKRVTNPSKVPSGNQQIHALTMGHPMRWFEVLSKRPHTDLYGMLNSSSASYVRLLEEPNITAFIFPRHLRTKGNADPSPFPSYIILGAPPLRRDQMGNLDPLPPSFVWNTEKQPKVIGKWRNK